MWGWEGGGVGLIYRNSFVQSVSSKLTVEFFFIILGITIAAVTVHRSSPLSRAVQVGCASETLSEWADDEAGLEAVQKVVDSLDDIYALQDPLVEQDVLRDILRDDRLHMLLQVRRRSPSLADNTLFFVDDRVNPNVSNKMWSYFVFPCRLSSAFAAVRPNKLHCDVADTTATRRFGVSVPGCDGSPSDCDGP